MIALLAMLLVQGLRDITVGVDTQAYFDIFKNIITQKEFIEWNKKDFLDIEIGYVLLNVWISYINCNYQVFIFVISAIMLIIHLYFLKRNSKDFFISVLLFLCLGHFITSMVSIRQYLALGIVMWIVPELEQKQYKKFIITGIVAFMLHNSALIFLVSYLVLNRVKSIKQVWGILLGSIILLPLTNIIKNIVIMFLPKYAFYNDYQPTGIGFF